MQHLRNLMTLALALGAGTCMAAEPFRMDVLAGANVQSEAGAVPSAQLALSWGVGGNWSAEAWISKSRSESLSQEHLDRVPEFRAVSSTGLGVRYQFHREDTGLQPYLRAGWARSKGYIDSVSISYQDCSTGELCLTEEERFRYRTRGDTPYFGLGARWDLTEALDLNTELLYLPTARRAVVSEQVQLLLGLGYHF